MWRKDTERREGPHACRSKQVGEDCTLYGRRHPDSWNHGRCRLEESHDLVSADGSWESGRRGTGGDGRFLPGTGPTNSLTLGPNGVQVRTVTGEGKVSFG